MSPPFFLFKVFSPIISMKESKLTNADVAKITHYLGGQKASVEGEKIITDLRKYITSGLTPDDLGELPSNITRRLHKKTIFYGIKK